MKMDKVSSRYTILRLVLESGERLPCLVYKETWLPVRVATRWVIRYRRRKVQSSTLANNLRVVKKIYDWADNVAKLDMDEFLTSGRILNVHQIESLVNFVREKTVNNSRTFRLSMYNSSTAIIEDFLKWSLNAENRGGTSTLSIPKVMAHRVQIELLFKTLYIRGSSSKRIQPLEEAEIAAIRQAIAPHQNQNGKWEFPQKGFSRQTAFRNWLMIELAYQLGLRRGELLKLRLDCLPRGANDAIKVMRLPNDRHDSRTLEPAVKTAERAVPVHRTLLKALRIYITYPPPLGRIKTKSPYLFVTRTGAPLSMAMSNDIIKAIGKHSGIKNLSWHRFRHTWAERMAEKLCPLENGFDRLMYLGGWTNPNSPRRYIEGATAKQAMQSMREYQTNLYGDTE